MWYAAMIAALGIPMAFMGMECHHDGWWHVDKNRCFNWWYTGKRSIKEYNSWL
jgi:hypothetical protein